MAKPKKKELLDQILIAKEDMDNAASETDFDEASSRYEEASDRYKRYYKNDDLEGIIQDLTYNPDGTVDEEKEEEVEDKTEIDDLPEKRKESRLLAKQLENNNLPPGWVRVHFKNGNSIRIPEEGKKAYKNKFNVKKITDK